MAAVTFTACGGEQKEKDADGNKDTVVEVKDTTPAYEYKYQVAEETVAPGWWINIGDSLLVPALHDFFSKSFQAVAGFAGKNKQADSPMLASFTDWSETKKFYVRAGRMVTDSTLKVKGNMKLEKFYAGKALKVQYMGNYGQDQMVAYNDLMQYMKEKELTQNGASWEVYLTNPMTEKDTAKWETHIFIPVK
jgi:effector-binding domain-containing protein